MKCLFVLMLFAASSSFAGYFQSPVSDANLRDIVVNTEFKQNVALSSLFDQTKVMIFVPAYFSCNSTCPLMVENLREAVRSSKAALDVKVVFLSFNPSDKAEDITMFRHHHDVPENWILAVAQNESESRELLNPFGYVFQKTKDGYDHPNSAFVFSKDKMKWTGVFVGIDAKAEDIDKAVRDARFIDLNGTGAQIAQYITRPEYLIVIGCVGLVVSLLAIIFTLLRKVRAFSKEGK